ncbi:hypothetical protein HEP75_01062 [Xanthomonas sp. SI]|nr:hypothetical protein HEP75_01062 [Xanthomonas sp. SI]
MMWAGWLLWDSLPSLSKSIPRLRIGWLSLALIGVPISSYLAFEGFHTLFREMRQNLYKRTTLAHLYFTGQLMKHLPGRVWGIAYQSGTGTSATLAEWISVNATYMALTTAFAIWISITVVGTMLHWWLGLALLGTGSVIYAYCWHPRPINAALDLARRIPSRAVARLCDALRPFATASARLKGEVWAWLTASWLVYLLAWSAYGVAWPGLTAVDGIWLCGIYTAAWFVGYISLITPSGIGVRELMFVLMASHFPSDAVAGLAVLGRISLLIADISLGLIFAPYRVRS